MAHKTALFDYILD